jgi:hypothetical protein
MTFRQESLEQLSFIPVRQRLASARLREIEPAVEQALVRGHAIHAGERIAVAVGSRGIDRIDTVVRSVVMGVRTRGASPFVLAAMGSHGGATADGQREVLAGYGITEATVGAPVEASMKTIQTRGAPPVAFSRLGAGADGIVLVNRVKPHSSLTGNLGSGLRKMLAVGLGNQSGARALHQSDLARTLPRAADALLAAVSVRAGVAVVEDALGQLAHIEGTGPERLVDTDVRLLARARQYLPSIPIDPLDGLVFLWMGKNISGTGMDPNVIGMHRRSGGPEDRRIGTLAVLRLTPESRGNGNGVGMADVVSRGLVDSIDMQPTGANARTTGWEDGARLPPVLPSEAEVIARACGGDVRTVRAVIARDTAHLDRFLITPALLPAIRAHPRLKVSGDPIRLEFDDGGRLLNEIGSAG